MTANHPTPEARRARLRHLIESAKLRDGLRNTKDWADTHNLSRSAIMDIVRGRYTKYGEEMQPKLSTINKLAIALDIGADELIKLFFPDIKWSVPKGVDSVALHVAGWAGAGPEQNMIEYQDIFVDRKLIGRREALAFVIRGDSMDGGKHSISDGDIVIADVNDKGYNGAIVVARVKDDSYVCKVIKNINGNPILVSQNLSTANESNSLISADSITEIVGRVFFVFKPVG